MVMLEDQVLKRKGELFWPARCELFRVEFLTGVGLDKFYGFSVSFAEDEKL